MQHGTTRTQTDAHAGHREAVQGTTPMQHAHPDEGGATRSDADAHAGHTAAPKTNAPMQHGGMHGEPAHAMHAMHGSPSIPIEPLDVSSIDPSATLAVDSLDATSPVSKAEAAKAAANIPDGDIRHIVPGNDSENPPTPQPAIWKAPPGTVATGLAATRGDAGAAMPHAHAPAASAHDRHAPSATSEDAGAIHACPMHPEVTSREPGAKCPKCGMALEKKEQ